MLVFLEMNEIEVICTDEELIRLGLELASVNISYEDLLNWIMEKS